MNVVSPLHRINLAGRQLDILVPLGAVSAFFIEDAKYENEQKKIANLSDNMTNIFMSVILQKLKTVQFATIAAIAVGLRTLDKKNNNDKAASVIKDSLWLGCGLAVQKVLSKHLLTHNNRGPLGIFSFITNMCSFTIGALLISPIISNYLIDNLKLKPKNNGIEYNA